MPNCAPNSGVDTQNLVGNRVRLARRGNFVLPTLQLEMEPPNGGDGARPPTEGASGALPTTPRQAYIQYGRSLAATAGGTPLNRTQHLPCPI